MFALAALICFVLALFHVRVGSIDLAILGWCFIALHLMLAGNALPAIFRRGRGGTSAS